MYEAYNNYLSMLGPDTANQVEDFYFPNADGSKRGVPTYSGADSNPYSSINPNRYAGMNRKDNPADKLYADLIRAQTQDYNTRFAPVENFLANEITATGTRSLDGDMTRTRAAVTGAGQNVRGQQDRAMGRYGLSSNNGGAGQSEVSSLVGGLNDTKARDIDRRTALLTGSMSGIAQNAKGAGK